MAPAACRRTFPVALMLGMVLALLPLSVLQAAAAPPPPPASVVPEWTIDDQGRGSLTLRMGQGLIAVSIDDAHLAVGLPAVTVWLQKAARALIGFFGRYPVPMVHINITVDGEPGAHDGVTHEGRHISISLGPGTRDSDLADDWIITHEMFHLSFPDLDDRHLWIEEGLATYLEPLARARIGDVSVDSVWQQLVEGLPQGQPGPGDGGLENTHTWGRTYWGGCLYCLLADCTIRSRSHGRYALDDCLRAILAAGGDGSQEWSLERTLAIGDAAVHLTVLEDLYQQLGLHAVTEDLPALWTRLGVTERHGRMSYDDQAPWADIRLALTRPLAVPPRP